MYWSAFMLWLCRHVTLLSGFVESSVRAANASPPLSIPSLCATRRAFRDLKNHFGFGRQSLNVKRKELLLFTRSIACCGSLPPAFKVDWLTQRDKYRAL